MEPKMRIHQLMGGVMVDTDPFFIEQELRCGQRGEIEEVIPGITICYGDSDPYFCAVALKDGRGVLRIDCIAWRLSFTERLRNTPELMALLAAL
jgi:hypothetical protein